MNYWEKKSDYPALDYRSINFSGKWTKHYINQYVDSIFTIGFNDTQQKFYEYKKEHFPTSLYKFFPPSLYSLINLQNQSIYLASPRKFNDPFDSFVCVEVESYIKLLLLKKIKELGLVSVQDSEENFSETEYWNIFHSWSNEDVMPRHINHPNRTSFGSTIYAICKTKSEALNRLVNQIQIESRKECSERIENIRNMQFKISCFSEFKSEEELLENTTMWSHYAENHSGFCIKYSLEFNALENKESVLCGLFPITYTSKVPKISPKSLMNLKYKKGKLELDKSILKTTLKTLTTKSIFWNYEKEWRVIISEQNSETILNSTISFLAVDTIYLGCKIEANLRKSLIEFAEEKNIKIYQTYQSNEKFTLNAIHQNSNTIKHEEFMYKLNRINEIENYSERFEKASKLLLDDRYK